VQSRGGGGGGEGAGARGGAGDDSFWDFKEETKKDEPKEKEVKGSSKTLNKAQLSQFEKWCQMELQKLTGSDDTTLAEFLMSLHRPEEVFRWCYIYMHIRMYMYLCMYVYIYLYIYIFTHIHTYIHTYIYNI
jgi:hypothetical protein